MDKNTFLAVVLSGAIMVIWYTVFPPPEPPPREYTDSIEQENQENIKLSPQSKQFEDESSKLSTSSTLTSIAEVDSSLPSKEVILENDNYRLVLDTRGGIGKSLQLKNFKHTKPRLTLSTWLPFLTSFLGPDYQDEITDENLVQMFGNHLDEIPPFFQEFIGDSNTTSLFQNTVFAASEDYTIYGGGNGSPSLKLTSPILNGIQMIKTFEALPDSYILNYRVQLINRSREIKPLKALYLSLIHI